MKLPSFRATIHMLCLAAVPLLCHQAYAQLDTGLGISPSDSNDLFGKEKKVARPIDPYVRFIAQHFNQREQEVAKLSGRGYGRNELIRMLLIVQKSGKDLKDVVRQRDRNKRLSVMASEYKLDYPALLTQADKIRKELDYQVAASSATVTFDVRASSTGIIISTHQAGGNIPVSSTTAPSGKAP